MAGKFGGTMRILIREFVGDRELVERRQEIEIESDTLLTLGRLDALPTNHRIQIGNSYDAGGSDAFAGLSRVQATINGFELIDGRLQPTRASQLGIWVGGHRVNHVILHPHKCPEVTLFNSGLGRIELRVLDDESDPDSALMGTLSEGNLLAELRHYITTLEAQVRRLEETTTSAIAALQARDAEHDTRIRWQSVWLLSAVAVACVVWLLAGEIRIDQTFAIALLSAGSAIGVAVINKK